MGQPTKDQILEAFTVGMKAATFANPTDWLADWLDTGTQSDSGVKVNGRTSLTYSSVWAAVRLISADIASVPLHVYEIEADGDLAVDIKHPAHWLLNHEPNEYMTAFTFREILMQHVLLWGNAYALIDRDTARRPIKLTPLLPDRTWPEMNGGRLTYKSRMFTDDNGTDSEVREFPPDRIFHVPGLGFEGIRGYSVITMARNSWGLGMATEKHGNRHFKNGAKPGIWFESDRNIDKVTADKFLDEWEKRHGGADNTGRPALTSGGITIKPLPPMSNEDSEWLDSRKFQRTEVAAWFLLPPHKIGDDSRLSFSSIEAENKAYVNQTLRQWFEKFGAESSRRLLGENDKSNHRRVIKHDPTDLIGVDINTLKEVWTGLVASEVATRNEARRKFNLPKSDDPKADSLTNPNTTSGSDATEPQPVDDPEDTMPLDAHRRLISDRLERTMDVERLGVCRKAKQMKDGQKFSGWLYQYYSTIETKAIASLEPVIEACNAIPGVQCSITATEAGRKWADISRAELLEVSGYSTDDELHANVTSTFAGWSDRPLTFATSILEV